MRAATQAKIDALHAQIAELVAAEKEWHDKQHTGENYMHRNISHTQIDYQAWAPKLRNAASGYSVLKIPVSGKEAP